jgi:hypothetical protein
MFTHCAEEAPVDPIPKPLATVESLAEAAFDAALAGDNAKLQASAKEAALAWNGYRAQALKDGVAAADLDEVGKATADIVQATSMTPAKGTPLELARACDAISAPMSRIYAVYRPAVPVLTLDLDYRGREVLLDARGADFVRAQSDLDLATTAWTTLKPKALAVNGAAAVDAMDKSLAQMKIAISQKSGADLEAAAKQELDAVDLVEVAFTKATADQND